MGVASILALLTLEGIGIRALILQPFWNGLHIAVSEIRDTFPSIMPGSKNVTLVTEYTTLLPLDRFLTTLQITFANVFDGTAPGFTLFGFYFAGQLVPAITVMMVEGLREGNKGEVVSWPLAFVQVFQLFSFAMTMPIYCILYLFNSLTAVETPANIMGQLTRITDLGSLGAVIPAISLGFILPSVVLGLRPYMDPTLHQYLVAIWQFFPLLVKISQLSFSPMFSEKKKPADRTSELKHLRNTYRFAINIAAFTHVATFVMLARIAFFPAKIKNAQLIGLTPLDVFGAQPFWSTEKMRSFAHAMQSIFVNDLYVGYGALIVLAATLYRVSRDATSAFVRSPSLVVELLTTGLFAGFGGILVALVWRKDEEVVAAEERMKQQKSS